MKIVKLSCVAAFAVCAFSSASALTFEEAIKNVEFAGNLRYRYTDGNWDKYNFSGQSNSAGKQNSHFRARLGARADVGDGFKVFGQIEYRNTREGGYEKGTGGDSYSGSYANTTAPFVLRQALLEYDASDYGFKTLLGRQELGTIWTDDYVGLAGKAVYTGLEGITLAAFIVNGFEQNQDGDQINPSDYVTETSGYLPNLNYNTFWNKNFYGAAAIAGYDLGGGSSVDAQAWFGYFDKRVTYYAVDAKYTLGIDDGFTYSLQANYLGNSVEKYLKNRGWDNGSFVSARGKIEMYGLDASLGGMMYGKKDKLTTNTIEDTGRLATIGGRELIYSKGSKITDSFGQNTYGYVTAGYTYEGFRIGAQYVMGATTTGLNLTDARAALGGGKKSEIVGELSYKYNKNLDFLLWYSNLSVTQEYKATAGGENIERKSTKDMVRFQAYYAF